MKRLLLLLLVVLAACSKDDPTAPVPFALPPSTAGTWTISIAGGFVGTLRLKENETLVSGSGTVAGLSANIAGEDFYPKVSFSMSAPGYQPAAFSGSFSSPTVITGVFNGSGFTNTGATLTKW